MGKHGENAKLEKRKMLNGFASLLVADLLLLMLHELQGDIFF
jgi:hypothetical protein